MQSFFESTFALGRREDGQTMAEYGVVLAVITLAVVVALGALSGAIGDAINAVTGIF
jgi:Flp pilus assembly pilin Flp